MIIRLGDGVIDVGDDRIVMDVSVPSWNVSLDASNVDGGAGEASRVASSRSTAGKRAKKNKASESKTKENGIKGTSDLIPDVAVECAARRRWMQTGRDDV